MCVMLLYTEQRMARMLHKSPTFSTIKTNSQNLIFCHVIMHEGLCALNIDTIFSKILCSVKEITVIASQMGSADCPVVQNASFGKGIPHD